MPYMDGAGPFGTGPIGRGLGPCGRGSRGRFFRGWGMDLQQGAGFGWSRAYILPPDEEIYRLEQEKSWLEKQIDALNKRLSSLQKNNQTDINQTDT